MQIVDETDRFVVSSALCCLTNKQDKLLSPHPADLYHLSTAYMSICNHIMFLQTHDMLRAETLFAI